MFVVVAVDEENDIVELQHFDGDIEEVELKNWRGMELELSEAPEDWSGPVDNIERDDTGYSETNMSNAAWREPVEENPRSPTELWEDTTAQEERDDWTEGAGTEEPMEQHRVENTKLASVHEEESSEAEESELKQ